MVKIGDILQLEDLRPGMVIYNPEYEVLYVIEKIDGDNVSYTFIDKYLLSDAWTLSKKDFYNENDILIQILDGNYDKDLMNELSEIEKAHDLIFRLRREEFEYIGINDKGDFFIRFEEDFTYNIQELKELKAEIERVLNYK